MDDWKLIYQDIEDRLAPQLDLDAWERTTYYHLLRHTRLEGKQSSLFSIGPLSIGVRFQLICIREKVNPNYQHPAILRVARFSGAGCPSSFH